MIPPDPVYQSEIVAKFINFIMERGKKSVAQRIVYGAFDIIKEKSTKGGSSSLEASGKNESPLKLFEQAVDAVRPQMEVRSRRVGGANYQVPLPVLPHRQNALAFRWIVGAAHARKGRGGMKEKLAAEIMDILGGTGGALKKREDVHRMAESNKAFAHFARFHRK
jgi:small subunit ribosomal protein S7